MFRGTRETKEVESGAHAQATMWDLLQYEISSFFLAGFAFYKPQEGYPEETRKVQRP